MRLLILLLICLFPTTSCGFEFQNVKYVRNYDGDTITVNIAGVHPLLGDHIKIRLNDIDTYEVTSKNPAHRKLALDAKLYVESVMKRAKRIDLVDVKRCAFFRLVADVLVDGKDLATMVKKRGFDENKEKVRLENDED